MNTDFFYCSPNEIRVDGRAQVKIIKQICIYEMKYGMLGQTNQSNNSKEFINKKGFF